MRFDPDCCSDSVTHIHNPGVLTGPDENPGRLGRKAPEMDSTALVGTVLGPHHRVHGEFERVRRTIQNLVNPSSFVVGETEGSVEGLAHGPEP